MPHYKHGKQKQLLTFEQIYNKVSAAKKHLTLESLAFFWLLYYCGCRKSEAYERTVADIKVTEDLFIIDFHQRKKRGETVDPLEIPRSFPGVDLLCEQLLKAKERKPSRKQLIHSPEKGIIETRIVKARWLFPHINRTWAGVIVKRIMGEKYYPHYLRLNRLSEIGSDPGANIIRLKSYSGIKSVKALEAYLGTSKKEQDAAIKYMATQINPEQQSKS